MAQEMYVNYSANKSKLKPGTVFVSRFNRTPGATGKLLGWRGYDEQFYAYCEMHDAYSEPHEFRNRVEEAIKNVARWCPDCREMAGREPVGTEPSIPSDLKGARRCEFCNTMKVSTCLYGQEDSEALPFAICAECWQSPQVRAKYRDRFRDEIAHRKEVWKGLSKAKRLQIRQHLANTWAAEHEKSRANARF